MKKYLFTILLVSAVALFLAACGGGGESADSGGEEAASGSVGNAANGEKLYTNPTIGSASAPGCNTCHSLEADVVLVGPSHAGIAARAETAVDGMSAEEYLRDSIVNPDAHVTEGYAAGVMYQNYGAEIPEPQINDLVAFLLTQ